MGMGGRGARARGEMPKKDTRLDSSKRQRCIPLLVM